MHLGGQLLPGARPAAFPPRLFAVTVTRRHPRLLGPPPVNPIQVVRAVIVARHNMVQLITARLATPVAHLPRVALQRLRFTPGVPVGGQPLAPRRPGPPAGHRRRERPARRPAFTFARSPRSGRPTFTRRPPPATDMSDPPHQQHGITHPHRIRKFWPPQGAVVGEPADRRPHPAAARSYIEVNGTSTAPAPSPSTAAPV